MKRLVISVCLAALLWFVMFSPWTAPLLNFWWAMTASACILIALSTLAQRRDGGSSVLSQFTIFNFKEVLLGIGIAVVLWFVFYVGDKVSQWMFDFARPQVNLIYDMKTGNQPWLIALLLLFIIGPAEEIFWRGYIQRQLSQRWSPNVGFLVTTAIYTAVHLPSGNFMLVMAAMVCGVAWGGLYRLMPQHFPAIVLSHALWDAAAFVWFPL
ncbi:MAG: CPBP family intramembrane metalloprotease [Bacteroidaceae bacterium]|nr:CPBP family intramembrane metalloprotease [Bacteroidaceae bacterium]MBR3443946.1 CPBP family intramembrane metalloprotease [Bacteroidaceae bacterium]